MAKGKLSSAERDQLLQTVQMFEVIAETQPNDVQSLEILKEAYIDLGKDKDAVGISKKIAQAYVNLGQLSSAILEYEGILQKFPDDSECLAALESLEGKMGGIGAAGGKTEGSVEAAKQAFAEAEQFEDPNEALLKFFQENQMISEKDAKGALAAMQTSLGQTPFDKPTMALLTILSDRGIASVDKSLSLLAEKTHIPFIPLGVYDVDSAKSSLLEKAFCLKHLILPFDQISKTTLVATVNPFNAEAKREIESLTEGRTQWYLADPLDLVKQLKSVYRIV